MHKNHLFIWICIGVFFIVELAAHEILVNTQDGEMFVVDVDPSESLHDLQGKIVALTQGRESHALLDLSGADNLKDFLKPSRGQGQYIGRPRDYFIPFIPVSDSEKEDIYLIVSSLAKKSRLQVAFIRSQLDEAGYRINKIHPFRFLITIFTDEEMKVLIRNVRSKQWAWDPFLAGLRDSLATEASIGNIRAEHILDFSEELSMHPELIKDSLGKELWDKFVDVLFDIPRSGDPDHYDN